MSDKLLTFPLDPQWRETIKEDPRWSKAFKETAEKRSPWLVDSMVNILAHETTEKVLTRLVRASKDGLPAAYFCDVLFECWAYVHMTGYKKGKIGAPWMTDRKQLRRMAETSRDIKIKLSRIIETIQGRTLRFANRRILGVVGERSDARLISIFADGYMKDVRFTDKEILDALDAVADFWEIMAKPKTPHRPEQWFLHYLLGGLEYQFRDRFSKPLYPVIAQLVQVAVDVRQMTNGETKTDKWTDKRVITMLKRIHQANRYHRVPSIKS